MEPNTNIVLMNHERADRSLKRMAHEIAEQNKNNIPVLLFGIDERGYAIANKLADILDPMFEENVRAIQLPLKADINGQPFKQLKIETAKESFIIVVDDVIFSGQTMFIALKKITNHVDPSEIHTAVLIDRGHRKFPIKAEFCGINLPTKQNEHVRVIAETDNVEKVILEKT